MAVPYVGTFISALLFTLLVPGAMALTPGTAPAGDRDRSLPEPFGWCSTGPLIGPEPDAGQSIVAVGGPRVFRYEERRHDEMTTADSTGARSLAPTGFADRSSRAADMPLTCLDADPDIGDRYAAVCRTGSPSCSTTKDPRLWLDPRDSATGATAPGPSSRTDSAAPGSCPAEPSRFDLFEASNLYRDAGTGKCLLLVEAPAASTWMPPAGTEPDAFIRSADVTFQEGRPAWTKGLSQGGMIRGMNSPVSGRYPQLPWPSDLLSQTGSSR